MFNRLMKEPLQGQIVMGGQDYPGQITVMCVKDTITDQDM